MQTWKRPSLGFFAALVAAIGLALPAGHAFAGEHADSAATGAAKAAAAAVASIPIELPDGPAQPKPGELVGGYHGFVIFVGAVFFVAFIVAAADAHHHYCYHHHYWADECEGHWHHHH